MTTEEITKDIEAAFESARLRLNTYEGLKKKAIADENWGNVVFFSAVIEGMEKIVFIFEQQLRG